MHDTYEDRLDEQFNDALEEAAGTQGFSPDGYDFEGYDGYDGYDGEGDAFFGKALQSLRKLPLGKIASMGAKVAGGLIGGPIGAKVGGMVGNLLQREGEGEGEGYEPEFTLEGEAAWEGERDGEEEDEGDGFGLDSFSDSLAESLAAQAVRSGSDAESSALLGGVTIHIVTGAPVSVRRMSSHLVKSGHRLGDYFRKSRATRPLTATIPTIQKRAVGMLSRHANNGGKVTPRLVNKAMAKATQKTLGSPRAAARSLANNAVKSRRAGDARPSASSSARAIARAER
jgi:hypothetical protein